NCSRWRPRRPGSGFDIGSTDIEAARGMAVEEDLEKTLPVGQKKEDREAALGRTQTADTTPHVAVDPGRLSPIDPGRYHIVREFAHGGLGRILEVRDLRLGRVVALK